jgi:putative nucleotidyltransferase with HDIG domain
MGKIQSRPLNAISEAQELINAMTEQLLSVDEMVLHLVSDSDDGNSLQFHSLNVSVLSMLLARECKLPAEAIRQVGMALFHDIGKLKIPSQILRKTEPLTKPEQNLMAQHPRYGLELLGLVSDFPEAAKQIVQNHHEYLDGTGPQGLKGDQLDPLTQIVSLINEYDNLCHLRPRCPTRPRQPLQAAQVPVQRRSPRHADPADGGLPRAAWCSSPTARWGW